MASYIRMYVSTLFYKEKVKTKGTKLTAIFDVTEDNLLYKAEKPSVRPSPSDRRTGNSVVSACIKVGLALHVSYVLWHVQVCFKKFLSAIVCPPER